MLDQWDVQVSQHEIDWSDDEEAEEEEEGEAEEDEEHGEKGKEKEKGKEGGIKEGERKSGVIHIPVKQKGKKKQEVDKASVSSRSSETSSQRKLRLARMFLLLFFKIL